MFTKYENIYIYENITFLKNSYYVIRNNIIKTILLLLLILIIIIKYALFKKRFRNVLKKFRDCRVSYKCLYKVPLEGLCCIEIDNL